MAEIDFAKLDSNNMVLDVICVTDTDIMVDGVVNEDAGIQFLVECTKHALWKMSDRGMYGGVNIKGGALLRKNAPTIGGTYDPAKDAFIPIKEHDSWTLNETTCLWEAPFELTQEQIGSYKHWWSETEQTYVGTTPENVDVKWNTETSAWENWTP